MMIITRFFLAVFSLFLITLQLNAAEISGSSSKKLNFLVIVADDLGYSDLSSFGSEIQTPNIDALAAQGMRMTNFHTASVCSATRAELLSGTDNHVNGLGNMLAHRAKNQEDKPGYEGYLNKNIVTVSVLLRDAGYDTYMTGKWHLGMSEELSPKARGFKRSFALLPGGAGHMDQTSLRENALTAQFREDDNRVNLPEDFGFSSEFYTRQMIKYIDQDRKNGKPFFAYLAYTAPHWPLQAPDSYLDKYAGKYDAGPEVIKAARLERMKNMGIIPENTIAHPIINSSNTGQNGEESELWYAYQKPATIWAELPFDKRRVEARKMEIYAAMVANLDDNVGRIIEYLKSIDEFENTVIIFMSDNGAEGMPLDRMPGFYDLGQFDNSFENMGRRGSYVWYGETWAQVSMTPLRLFKGLSSEGGIRVPAFIRYGGLNRQQQTTNQLLSVKDIVPTLLEFAHVDDPNGNYQGREVAQIQGKSWVSMLNGKEETVRSENEGLGWELLNKMAYIKGKWKILRMHTIWGNGEWQLYDLSVDLSEMNDLADVYPDILLDLIASYDAYAKENGVVLGSSPPDR